MKLQHLVWPDNPVSLPFYSDLISAGFPSPAADYIDSGIDLVSHLIAHPSSTYVLRVAGDSMRDVGILDGSLLLVDFSIKAQHNDIVVANLAGEFTVKRLVTYPVAQLRAENPNYPAIPIYDADGLEIVGVVICVINTLHRNVRAG
ncbi:translesion error-prone DNA polymerase V autoproteolytic subunit [Franconibacter helveticus]|uniref:translesion error-prone DNA polymerase V autoproteolytic subunit n=1 Tax=Franconibacter helveticus TaxID=357240 RepID=UPI000DA11F03|nr:translesion error-prone DNA polymerase V autoproteolytic subunit [Franconibacter helveticus]